MSRRNDSFLDDLSAINNVGDLDDSSDIFSAPSVTAARGSKPSPSRAPAVSHSGAKQAGAASRERGSQSSKSDAVRTKNPRPAQRNTDAPVSAAAKSKNTLITSEPAKAGKPPVSTMVLIGIVSVMCLLTALFVPSGDSISGTGVLEQRSASFDIKTGMDTIVDNAVNDALDLPRVYVLPMSEAAAPKPNEDNYGTYIDDDRNTHYTYEDVTISVDCWRFKAENDGATTLINAAKVKISHPTQLRTAMAGGKYSDTVRFKPSEIARQVNAVVAINGDLYNYASTSGVLFRQGTLYRESQTDKYSLFIDSNGDFKIISGITAFKTKFYNDDGVKIYHSFNFGPAMIVDGEVLKLTPGSGGAPALNFYRNPRSAIGQIGPLEYLLVAAEGRNGRSAGITSYNLALIMKELGCVQAYNLDGGQSSTLIFHDEMFNMSSNGGERTLSDIIYFATALPEDRSA